MNLSHMTVSHACHSISCPIRVPNMPVSEKRSCRYAAWLSQRCYVVIGKHGAHAMRLGIVAIVVAAVLLFGVQVTSFTGHTLSMTPLCIAPRVKVGLCNAGASVWWLYPLLDWFYKSGETCRARP